MLEGAQDIDRMTLGSDLVEGGIEGRVGIIEVHPQ